MMPDRITEYALPGILQQIARLCTPDIAVAIARKWGGRRLYVPETIRVSHDLSDAIGRRAALLICSNYGGEQILIPSCRAYLRWYDARRMRASGKSIAEISRAIGVSTRRVFKLLEGFHSDDLQVEGCSPAHAEICPICQHKLRVKRKIRADTRQLEMSI
jgi:Mor family transcriptional regulator